MTETKSGNKLSVLLLVVVLIAGGAMLMAGPIGARDETRWLHLSVAWSPTPRKQPVAISYAINGVQGIEIPPAYHSPWPSREIAVRRGETVILRAIQREPGTLSCSIHERARLVAHDIDQELGVVECVVAVN